MAVQPAQQQPTVTRWRFTVEDYYRLADCGILPPDARVELIDGEIIQMNPIGDGHAGHVKRFNRILGRLTGDRILLSVQDPLRLGDGAEPQPDVVLLRPRADDYTRGHPTAADVLLLIEIADSSLAYDRDVKGPLYARAGIADYWIVDLNAGRILVHRDPGEAGYQAVSVLVRGDVLRPLAFPDVAIPVSEILV